MYNKIIVAGSAIEFQTKMDNFFDELNDYYYPKMPIYTVVNSCASIVSERLMLYYCHVTYNHPNKHYSTIIFNETKKPK